MTNKEKAENLSKQFNRITEKLKENLDISEDLQVSGNDLIDCVNEKTQVEKIEADDIEAIDLLNLQNLVNDFKYVRNLLKENTECGKKIMNTLSSTLLDVDLEQSPEMIAAFSELNRSLTDNMKLFIQSYKEISNIIINLNKAKTLIEPQQKVTNNLNISNINSFENSEQASNAILSTAELIKKLRES